MPDEISKTEMLRLWEANLLLDHINVKDRVYATVVESEDNPRRKVWCAL